MDRSLSVSHSSCVLTSSPKISRVCTGDFKARMYSYLLRNDVCVSVSDGNSVLQQLEPSPARRCQSCPKRTSRNTATASPVRSSPSEATPISPSTSTSATSRGPSRSRYALSSCDLGHVLRCARWMDGGSVRENGSRRRHLNSNGAEGDFKYTLSWLQI